MYLFKLEFSSFIKITLPIHIESRYGVLGGITGKCLAHQENSENTLLSLIPQDSPNLMTICWRRQWHPTPVLLPGKSHGRRSLVGCCPWGREESDMTKRLHFHFSLLCTGEGNGNPLQYSCLENPRDGVIESDTTEVT